MEQHLCGESKEDIMEMLSVIRKICFANTCETCPFNNGDLGCSITDRRPDGWNLHSESYLWRAFD